MDRDAAAEKEKRTTRSVEGYPASFGNAGADEIFGEDTVKRTH